MTGKTKSAKTPTKTPTKTSSKTPTKTRATKRHDVVIIGAGLGGLSAALALAAAGARPLLLERGALDTNFGKSSKPISDPRATALSPASVSMLTRICSTGGKDAVPHLSRVMKMQISDGHPDASFLAAPLVLQAGILEAGVLQAESNSKTQKPIAHIVPNDALLAHLTQAVRAHKNINLRENVSVTALDIKTSGATLTLSPSNISGDIAPSNIASSNIAPPEKLSCDLVVAADGRNSALRDMAGIKTNTHDYNQLAMVCVIQHSRPHKNIAHQLFKHHGPLATLPLNGIEGDKKSAIVWSEKTTYAHALMALDDSGFGAELAARLDGLLGDITSVSPRLSYPLGVMLAADFTAERFALLGEAAHIIHPLAGQGYNLSLRDAACLADCYFDAKRLGLPIGSAGSLASYAASRRGDALMMSATTHSLNALFGSRLSGLSWVRQFGLGVANKLPLLSTLAARTANYGAHYNMGAAQNPPRLMRGADFKD